MNARINNCSCGSDEFVSSLKKYAVYKIVNGKLEFQKDEFSNIEEKIKCRECGKKIDKRLVI
jgi:hypothetical protein